MDAIKLNEKIGGSPISWSMIEESLGEILNIPARLTPNCRFEATGEGGGLVSSIFVLFLDWLNGEENLPRKALLKVTSKQSIINVSTALNGVCSRTEEECARGAAIIHDTEHFIYKNSTLWEFPKEIKIPRYLGGKDYIEEGIEAGYFLSEFVEKVSFVQYHDNISVHGVGQVLKSLAKMNAYLISNPILLEELKKFDSSPNGAKNYIKTGFKNTSNQLLQVASKYPELSEDTLKIFNLAKSFGTAPKMWQEAAKYCKFPLLTHWDCHLGNVLWSKTGNDYEMLGIIDWQTAHLNNPMIDVCRITLTALSPEDFDQNLDKLLKLYYDTLVENSKNKDKLPWDSYEEMLVAYEHVFPLKVVLLGALLGLDFFLEKITAPLPEADRPAAIASCEAKLGSYIRRAAMYAEKWYPNHL